MDAASLVGIAVLLSAIVLAVLVAMGGSLSAAHRGTFVLDDGTTRRFDSEAGYRALLDAHRGHIARATFEESVAAPVVLRVVFAAIYLSGLGYVVLRERRRLRAWMRPTPRRVAIGIALGALTATSAFVYEWGMARLGFGLDAIELPVRGLDAGLLLLLGVAVAPVVEELYFRGRLFRMIEQARGRASALWITTALFAAIHVLTVPAALPPYLVVSLALGWQRLRSGSLDGSIATHATHNAIAIVAALLAAR